MANWTKRNLRDHFNRAKANGWLPTFEKAAVVKNFPVEVVLAIGSRETNMRNIIGDSGHGHGIMQIDDRSFPEWCSSGLWENPHNSISKGVTVLWEKRREVANLAKAAGKKLSDQDLQRAAIAAYNHGSKGSYADLIKYDNPDRNTTGKDYSSDVLKRAEYFRELLAAEPSRVNTATPETPSDNEISSKPDPASESTVPTPAESTPEPADPAVGGPTSGAPVVEATIPAVPPLPTEVPGPFTRFMKWVGGLSLGSYLGSLAIFKDHPELLLPILALLKIVFVGLAGVGAVVAVMYFVERISKAKDSTRLNETRLQIISDPNANNTDLKGWKDERKAA